MNEEYLYVLDYSDSTVNRIYLNAGNKKPDDFETAEELLAYWGFKADQCAWMFSSNEFINSIVEPFKN